MHVGLRDAVIRVAGDPRPHAAAIYQDHLDSLESVNDATSTQFVVVDSESKVPEARERAREAELARREEYSPRGRDLAFERGGHPRWGGADQEEDAVLGVLVGTPDQVLKFWSVD